MRNPLRNLLDNIRGIVSPADADQTSDELLERYQQDRDESAFATLMDRYGGLVYGTCRRVLRDHAGVEDAFQATFLVLAQKAGSIRKGQGLGGWLHRVALHVAIKAKTRSAKRQERENKAVRSVANDRQDADVLQNSVVDEEICHLPEKYRTPLVMCYLEGRSNEDAAREIGCPVGTLWGRVSRGKQMLRDRLVRRGVALGTLPAIMAADGWACAAVPTTLAQETLHACSTLAGGAVTQAVKTPAWYLANEAMRTLWPNRMLRYLVIVSIACLFTGYAVSRVATWHAVQSDQPNHAILYLPHANAIRGCKFTHEGTHLWTLDTNGILREWQLPQGRMMREIAFDPATSALLDVSEDGGLVCLSDLEKSWVVDLDRNVELFRLDLATDGQAGSLTDNYALASLSPDHRQVVFRNVTDGRLTSTWDCGWKASHFKIQGTKMAAADLDGNIAIRDGKREEVRFQIKTGERAIGDIAFDSTADRLAVLVRAPKQQNCEVQIRDTKDGSLLHRLPFNQSVMHLHTGPSGKVIAQLDEMNPSVFTIDCQTGKSTVVSLGKGHTMSELVVAPSGAVARLGSDFTTLEIHFLP